MSRLFEFLALVLLLAGAVLLVWLALRGLALRWRVKRWPRRQGVVRSARIHHSRRRHHRPQFMVDYAGDRGNVSVMCESPTRSGFSEGGSAHAVLARYPVGGTVRLYLDPADPSRAFLWLPEAHMIVVFVLAAGILATAALAGFASAFNVDLVGLLARLV